MEGLVEGAARRGLVAEELHEGIAGAIAPEDASEEAGVLVVLLIGLGVGGVGIRGVEFEVPAQVVESVGDEAGFEAGDAPEAPVGGGQFKDEEALERALGLVFGAEGVHEFLELLAVLFGQDHGARGSEAVLVGVAADGSLAFGGFGARAAAGAAAVGFDLLVAGHGTPPATGQGGGGRSGADGRGKWLRGGQKKGWGWGE